MEEQNKLGKWLEQRCKTKHLSLREAGKRAGISHTTIAEVIRGKQPTATTIGKLARGFSDNDQQRQALEDRLLALAGYRTEQKGQTYLDLMPLLSIPHQLIIEALVHVIAKIEGIDTSKLLGGKKERG